MSAVQPAADGASARLRAAVAAAPTYREVGATTGALPGGYRHVERSGGIGHGRPAFDAAVARLLGWGVHRAVGLGVEATAPSASLGTTVLLRAGVGPLRGHAPCRVVVVVDQPRRAGFAYGTLPGHPEIGEELFLVTLDDHDVVRFTVTAFSRPATTWARLGGPVSRRVQDALIARYLTAAGAPSAAVR